MDIRAPNMMWNEENCRVMLIDFERAVIRRSASRSVLPRSAKKHQVLTPKGRQSDETEFNSRILSDLWSIHLMS